MLWRANAMRMIQAGLVVIGEVGSGVAATRCRILRRDSSIFGGWGGCVHGADYLSSRWPISVRGFHLDQASC